MSGVDVDRTKAQHEMLKGISTHPAIPKVFDFFQDGTCFYMIQDYYQGGDFTTLRQKARSQGVPLTENWWRDVFRQCFEGLAHLQDNGLIHCDMKEPNLMIRKAQYECPEVVIIDFGLFRKKTTNRTMVDGTAGYIPPEVWDTGKCYAGSDMFAMGVVMMQMVLDCVPPHHSASKWEVLPGGIFTKGVKSLDQAKVVAKTREPPFDSLPDDWEGLAQLTRKLLDKHVQRRPLAKEVLCDDWFSSAYDEEGVSDDTSLGNRLSEMLLGFFS